MMTHWRRRVAAGLLAITASAWSQSAGKEVTLHMTLVGEKIVLSRLQQYGGDDTVRETTLRQIFLEAGCPEAQLTVQAVPHLEQPNVICMLPGTGSRTIVVGANFDHVAAGDGVIDNWSGASMLPSLMQSLRAAPHTHTFAFVGFSGLHANYVGSKFYVSQMRPEQVKGIDAMVDLDMLGLGPTMMWAKRTDLRLAGSLMQMADAMKMPLGVVDLAGEADEEPFTEKHVCTVVVHSVTPENSQIIHPPDDNYKAVRWDDYFASYRLMVAYLTKLDGAKVPKGYTCKGLPASMTTWKGLGRLLKP